MNPEQPTNKIQDMPENIIEFPQERTKPGIQESIEGIDSVSGKWIELTKRQDVDNARLGELIGQIHACNTQAESVPLLEEVLTISEGLYTDIDTLLVEQDGAYTAAENAGFNADDLMSMREAAEERKQKNAQLAENITKVKSKLEVAMEASQRSEYLVDPEGRKEVFDQEKKNALAEYVLKHREFGSEAVEQSIRLRNEHPDLHAMMMDGMANEADPEVNSFVWEVIQTAAEYEKEPVDSDVAEHSNTFLSTVEEVDELQRQRTEAKQTEVDTETLTHIEQDLQEATNRQQRLLYVSEGDSPEVVALKKRFYEQVTRKPLFPPFGFRFGKKHTKQRISK